MGFPRLRRIRIIPSALKSRKNILMLVACVIFVTLYLLVRAGYSVWLTYDTPVHNCEELIRVTGNQVVRQGVRDWINKEVECLRMSQGSGNNAHQYLMLDSVFDWGKAGANLRLIGPQRVEIRFDAHGELSAANISVGRVGVIYTISGDLMGYEPFVVKSHDDIYVYHQDN